MPPLSKSRPVHLALEKEGIKATVEETATGEVVVHFHESTTTAQRARGTAIANNFKFDELEKNSKRAHKAELAGEALLAAVTVALAHRIAETKVPQWALDLIKNTAAEIESIL